MNEVVVSTEDYENRKAFEERLKAYRTLGKPIFLSPNTKVLYHCFITNSNIDPREVLLVNTVRDEIESSLNFKYSPAQIKEIKRDARYQQFLLDELVNRRMKNRGSPAWPLQNTGS